MSFNSLLFIFFLIVVLFLYYLSPHPFRWMVLLISSLVFYAAWDVALLFLMLSVVLINYAAAFLMVRNPSRKKVILIAAALINFGLLFIFKYANFFSRAVGNFSEFPELRIILPMGISFYTFQAMGYTIDVYRDAALREKNFFKFALFITFFPQLVAGPIERFSSLSPQLFSRKKFRTENLVTGLKYLAFGFFKKIVIADRVAAAVNTVYNNPTRHAGLPLIIATVLFAFQIYCDFSGYSDIAVGCAKMLGIDLMQNFKQPYLAKGIRDFWRRWHISLSTWFKDYLYFPLGGSRVPKARHYFNTMVTFLVSGLWHGANWTFVLWGALHGAFQVCGDAVMPSPPSAQQDKRAPFAFVKIVLTFPLVCFAWVFFRANTVSDAFYIAGHLFTGASEWTSVQYVFDVLNNLGVQFLELTLCGGAILLLMALEIFSGKRVVHDALAKAPAVARWAVYAVVVMAILSTGVFGNAGAFIYFQF